MFRLTISTAILFVFAAAANAHFVFVVPDKDGHAADVILSESLAPDDAVPIETIAATQLSFAASPGHDELLKLTKAEHSYRVDLAANQNGVIHGVAALGVISRGEAKPGVLTYYPKTILGDPFDARTRLGDAVPMELVPTGAPGKLKLLFVVASHPVPDAEVDLVLPDGTDQKVTTDKEGQTPVINAPGRYGVWARHVEATAGELNGKHYDEVRQYATLVMDVPPAPVASICAPLPQAASSFGAVACDGWLYVYGGHISDTHSYSTASVSGQFHRLNLADHKTWEELPGGPPLQGMNLTTWHGKIYLVGGMSPRNKEGEDADVRSVAECACFDPGTKTWTPIQSLPEPRSSHDVAVVGDKLLVTGGWTLAGDADSAHWLDITRSLDLSSPDAKWQTIKQPFERRAMIAASFKGKMYVVGGFQTEAEPSRRVDVYDPAANLWTLGPELPEPDQNGFGPAACVLNGRLYVSVADGTLYRLSDAGDRWETVAATTPRIVHRMVGNGSEIFVIGGAAKQKQLNLIEAVRLP